MQTPLVTKFRVLGGKQIKIKIKSSPSCITHYIQPLKQWLLDWSDIANNIWYMMYKYVTLTMNHAFNI